MLNMLRPIALAIVALSMAGTPSAAAPDAASSVLLFHNDKSRTGWYRHETALTPTTVNTSTFGKIWSLDLDGDVMATPLCVAGMTIGGRTRDVVYVATNNDSVYALDAADGSVIWGPKTLGPSLTNAQFTGAPNGGGHYGITSTPVIDLNSNTIYVAGLVQPGIKQKAMAWALDLRTGAVRKGWPVTIKGTYRGRAFDAGQVLQRGALLIDRGRLLISFGSRQDLPDWHGWVAAVDIGPLASGDAGAGAGHPVTVFTPDPDADGGGIWGVGGLAVDDAGAIYAVTGNGEYDLPRGGHDVGQCVLKLRITNGKLTFSEKPADYYVAPNYQYLNETDQDLGGSAEVLLPDLKGSSTPHLLLTAGKDGLVYLLNRDNVGKIVQRFRLYGDPNDRSLTEIRATPAYFENASGQGYVVITGYDPGPTGCNGVTTFKVTATPGGPARLVQEWTLPAPLAQPSVPEVSSNGADGAIVWVTERFRNNRGALDAFDASTGRRLYSTEENGARDGIGDCNSFTCPSVARGRVFIGTRDGVVAFGLLTAKEGRR